MDLELFRETVSLIKQRCNIILNLTTSGSGEITEEQRLGPLELRPELASFDAGSMNFGPRVFINSPQFLEKLAAKMKQYHVKPEIEVFDGGMIYNALRLVEKGLIDPPLHFQFVLGVRGGLAAIPRNLIFLVDSIPPGSTWSVVGIGKGQLPMALMSMAMGGHVRVGMEDNIYLAKGVLAKSNAEFVEKMVRFAREVGREVATPDDARKILGLT
jgi:3-keto-5-aminohexanoate cleavage enzyme